VIKSRRIRWAEHVAHIREGRSVSGVLVGKPKGKRQLERPRQRWEDNIKMDLKEVGIDVANWIQKVQDSPMTSFCEDRKESSGSIKKEG
jgi:hypothetical protein